MKTRFTYLFACLAVLSGTVASAQTTWVDGSYQPSPSQADPQELAWLLGNQLSGSISINYLGGEQRAAEQGYRNARELAQTVGVELPVELPPRHFGLDETLDCLNGASKRLISAIERKYGPREAATFELATIPAMSVLLHEQRAQSSELNATFVQFVGKLGQRAGLPSHVWAAFRRALADGAPMDEVSRRSVEMERNVFAHLTGNR